MAGNRKTTVILMAAWLVYIRLHFITNINWPVIRKLHPSHSLTINGPGY